MVLTPTHWVVLAGMKAAQSSVPQGPLSYLSTVTTAGNSDWGSQPLTSLAQQPSGSAAPRAPSPNDVPPTAAASAPIPQAAAKTGQGNEEESGGDGARQVSGRKQSMADRLLRKTGSASRSGSRNSAAPEAAAPVTAIDKPQTAEAYSRPPSALPAAAAEALATQVNGGYSTAVVNNRNQSGQSGQLPTWRKKESVPGVAHPQQPDAIIAPGSVTEAADWNAFGGVATAGSEQQSQQAEASMSAAEHESRHELSAPDVTKATVAGSGWAAFADPPSASDDAAIFLGLNDSFQEATLAPEPGASHRTNPFLDPGLSVVVQEAVLAPELATSHSTNPFLDPGLGDPLQEAPEAGASTSINPFLDPGQDPRQDNADSAAADDLPSVARTVSGDSFGDFNAPRGEDIEFEGAAWGATSAPQSDMTDWAAAAAPADPFAASASFRNFAALLEPAHTELVGDLASSSSTDATSLQAIPISQVDLSELESDFAGRTQQATQSAEPSQAAEQKSGTLLSRICI